MPPCTSGGASGAPTGTLPPTEGRAVFPIGVLRVSSNMVAGAPMQVQQSVGAPFGVIVHATCIARPCFLAIVWPYAGHVGRLQVALTCVQGIVVFWPPNTHIRFMWQGFKVVIRDIGLHMSNRVTVYSKEDAGLCRGALEARRGPVVSPMKIEFSSVQEFLESSQFVQVSRRISTGTRKERARLTL